jgi:tetratricopeptide (TPR) repeat protein
MKKIKIKSAQRDTVFSGAKHRHENNPPPSEYHYSPGYEFQTKERIDKAMQSALVCLKSGDLEHAETKYKEILAMQPGNVNALHFLGVTYYHYKKYEPAIKYIREALQIRPSYPDAYNSLGIIFQETGQFDYAVSCFRNALQLKPDFVESYVNLGNTFQNKGMLDEALTCFQRAVQLNPGLTDLLINMGNILHAKGSFDEAAECFNRAVRLDPYRCGTYNSLGIVLKDKMKFDEAVLCFERAIQLDPQFVDPYISLGNVLQAKGLIGEAISCFQKALLLSPDNAYANYNLSLALLQSGNFREGWEKYEWRRKIEGLSYLQTDFLKPLWDGSDMRGGIVLLLGEQGFGDIIQFVRYVPFVVQRNARVIVCCHKELKSLIQNVDGVQEVVTYGDRLPEFDVYRPILSLPFIFLPMTEDIPANIPYLNADPFLKEKWRKIIQSGPDNLKVGLVWSGNTRNVNLRYKSCLLNEFSALAKPGAATFYSLQKGETAAQAKNPPPGMDLFDYTEEINDFSDTAAFITNLDLIISVDTAVAHLAGALGKPVWTLLPYAADWRWMLNRKDSPWYPSMRLFRQNSPGDWDPLIDLVGKELENLAKCPSINRNY